MTPNPCTLHPTLHTLLVGLQRLLLRTAARTDPITRALSVLIVAGGTCIPNPKLINP